MPIYKSINKQRYTSGKYSIVPIRMQDRYDIMKWRNEQMYHLRQKEKLTKEQQDLYFENVIGNLFDKQYPEQILFSFLRNEECIGYGGLVHINWDKLNAEISFIMDTALERKSFDKFWSVFLGLIEQVAFNQLRLIRIYTYAFDLRPKLYPILEKTGYKKEARLKNLIKIDNFLKDVVIHSKNINEPWFRKADVGDLYITFRWASNSVIRKYAFNLTPILFENHEKWFNSKLRDKNCFYYILEDNKNKIGSIRFDVVGRNALISYLVDHEMHGKGYGKLMIEGGIKAFLSEFQKSINVVGLVKKENLASIKIFTRMNFELVEERDFLSFQKHYNP